MAAASLWLAAEFLCYTFPMDTKDGFGRSGIYGLLIFLLAIFGFVYYEMIRETDPHHSQDMQQKATSTTKTPTK